MGKLFNEAVVTELLGRLEERAGVVIDRESVKVLDQEESEIGYRYVGLSFDYVVNGTEDTQLFFVDSDVYGDGGFDWPYGESVEELTESFWDWLTVGNEV